MAIALTAAVSACDTKKEDAPLIEKQVPVIENGRMTPEILWAFGRVGNVEVSPDETKILYSVSYYSVEQNKSNSELFVMNTDGSGKKQITKTANKEIAAKWMSDSKHIAFLSNESGSMQLWTMKDDGTARTRLTDREGDISDFSFSPDERKVLLVADVKYGKRTADIHPDLPQASGIIVNDLMYKHWDEWVQTVPHPFIADIEGGKLMNEKCCW